VLKQTQFRNDHALQIQAAGQTNVCRSRVPKGRQGYRGLTKGRQEDGERGPIQPQETTRQGQEVKSKVNQAGVYTQPGMRKRLFQKIKAGTKGGDPGEWSARKAQLLAVEYKKAGGGYKK